MLPSQAKLASLGLGSLAPGLDMPEAGEHPREKDTVSLPGRYQASSLSSPGQSGDPNTLLLRPSPCPPLGFRSALISHHEPLFPICLGLISVGPDTGSLSV